MRCGEADRKNSMSTGFRKVIYYQGPSLPDMRMSWTSNTCYVSLLRRGNPVWSVLLSLFYTKPNWRSQKLSNVPYIACTISGRYKPFPWMLFSNTLGQHQLLWASVCLSVTWGHTTAMVGLSRGCHGTVSYRRYGNIGSDINVNSKIECPVWLWGFSLQKWEALPCCSRVLVG